MMTIPEELILPPRTIRRRGAVSALLPECRALGESGVVVHGRSLRDGGMLERIRAGCPPGLRVAYWEYPGGEPTLDQVDELRKFARTRETEWVAGVGGGSVIDAAKTCAGLLHAPLAGVAYHDGASIPAARTPFVAVPTTAGTGSECTAVCVLTNAATNVKKSFRHPSFIARLVILDADLLGTCPPNVIAASGMDALTQAIESYVSRGATWFSDALALQAVVLIASGIEKVFGGDRGGPGDDLLLGSYLAGIALTNARLGVVHGLAHPLGAQYHAPHGLACAVCLPHAIEFNRAAMGQKYEQLSRAVGKDLLERTRELLDRLRLTSPFAGKSCGDVEAIVQETLASGSTAANPRPVSRQDVTELLGKIFAA